MDFTACVKQRVPAQQIILPSSYENLDETLRSALPHNAYYVKKVIGRLIQESEKKGETPGLLYEMYCLPEILQAVELKPTDTDIVTYRIGSTDLQVSESPRLISGMGTTGLRTWEAALFLSEWMAGQSDFECKTVVELGCGTGLVGMSLIKNNNCNVIFTDGDAGVVEKMQDVLKANQISAEIKKVEWSSDRLPHLDVLVAADVTYDTSVLPSLLETLGAALAAGTTKILVAATVRNQDTIAAWETGLTKSFKWCVIATKKDNERSVTSHCWYPPGTPQIKIYLVERLDLVVCR